MTVRPARTPNRARQPGRLDPRRPEDNQHQNKTFLVSVSSGPNSVPDPPQLIRPMDFLNPNPLRREEVGQYSHLGSTGENRIASAPLMSNPPAEHSPAA
jgi:hypothetical protein